MNTIRDLSQYALQELKDSYNENEIRSLCRIIFSDVLHYTNIDIHIRKNDTLDESFVNKFYEIVRLLKQGEPLQYILGEARFAGLRFSLDSSTLIPRPETEELVLWVSASLTAGYKVLDIGTGSGCIAISLAKQNPGAEIHATDISPEAIRMAIQNAQFNQTRVRFFTEDILHFENSTWERYHLIVSNPPYVRESEKQDMESRVLDYEPHRALFVTDPDPLIFYRRIAEFGQQQLDSGGLLFFEINEALGRETVDMLADKGYRDIELRQDLSGKDRMIKSRKP